MSIHISEAVWRHSQAEQGALLVFLAIADCADAETGEAFPSVRYLAQKTRLSTRGVQYALARLIESGELSRLRRGAAGRSSVHKVNTQFLRQLPDRLTRLDANGDLIDANHDINSRNPVRTNRHGTVSKEPPLRAHAQGGEDLKLANEILDSVRERTEKVAA